VRVKVKGKWWKIQEADIKEYGSCTWSEKLIEIRPGQKPKHRLDTIIHELLHALRPNMSERDVREMAKVLTQGVWLDGWRRKTKDR
jgi:hypothetical protein